MEWHRDQIIGTKTDQEMDWDQSLGQKITMTGTETDSGPGPKTFFVRRIRLDNKI